MSIGVSTCTLIDDNEYKIGDNLQFLNKDYLAPTCVYLGRLKGSRTHLTFHFDKREIGKSTVRTIRIGPDRTDDEIRTPDVPV